VIILQTLKAKHMCKKGEFDKLTPNADVKGKYVEQTPFPE